jgi:PAS domain S-box-containing protein
MATAELNGAAWQTVLVIAPSGNDGIALIRILREADIKAKIHTSISGLCSDLAMDVGAVLLAEEWLTAEALAELEDCVRRQEAWSDLPIFVLTNQPDERFQNLGNVAIWEPTIGPATWITALRMGLRARARQFELRSRLKAEQEAAQALKDSERRYRTLAESLPLLVWTCDANGYCDYLSRQWVDYTGVAEDGQLGFGWLEQIHPEDRVYAEAAWRQAYQSGSLYDVEYRLRRHDGEYRWFKTRGVPARDAAGRLQKWFGSCTDIQDQKQILEERLELLAREQKAQSTLQRSIADLQRANEDLNQFAYSASHDLQEPLRMVALYSQMLQRKYGNLLDSAGTEYLNYITQGAKRMEMLLRDLLDYAQVVADDAAAADETAEASLVLEYAVQNLSQAITAKQADVQRSGGLPKLAVKEVHLLQLFQNLIGNALKYHGTQKPCVVISAQPESQMWRLSVRDNGIGIAAQYTRQVFGLFKRLHGRTQYEGTGLGLAICHKIVERYGGRIWVESEGEGQGSTFFFTLPGALAEASPAEANAPRS